MRPPEQGLRAEVNVKAKECWLLESRETFAGSVQALYNVGNGVSKSCFIHGDNRRQGAYGRLEIHDYHVS